MKTKATFTNGNLTVACVGSRSDHVDFAVTLSVTDMLDGMTPEDRRAFVDAVLMSEDILAGALRRLAGDTDCWRGDDERNREEWLISIGAVHEAAIKYANEAAERARDEARTIAFKARDVASEVFAHIRDAETVRPCCLRAVQALSELWSHREAPVIPPHAEPKTEVTP